MTWRPSPRPAGDGGAPFPSSARPVAALLRTGTHRRHDPARRTAADRTSRPRLSSQVPSGPPRRSPRADARSSMRRESPRRAAGDGECVSVGGHRERGPGWPGRTGPGPTACRLPSLSSFAVQRQVICSQVFGVASPLHRRFARPRPRSHGGRRPSARRPPPRGSPPGDAASSCPGWGRSTASGRAARRGRAGPASPPSAAAISPSRSTRAWFAFRASGVKRGTVLRKSELSSSVFSSIFPVRKPLPERAEGDEADAQLLAASAAPPPRASATTASTRSGPRRPAGPRGPGGSSAPPPRRGRSA